MHVVLTNASFASSFEAVVEGTESIIGNAKRTADKDKKHNENISIYREKW